MEERDVIKAAIEILWNGKDNVSNKYANNPEMVEQANNMLNEWFQNNSGNRNAVKEYIKYNHGAELDELNAEYAQSKSEPATQPQKEDIHPQKEPEEIKEPETPPIQEKTHKTQAPITEEPVRAVPKAEEKTPRWDKKHLSADLADQKETLSNKLKLMKDKDVERTAINKKQMSQEQISKTIADIDKALECLKPQYQSSQEAVQSLIENINAQGKKIKTPIGAALYVAREVGLNTDNYDNSVIEKAGDTIKEAINNDSKFSKEDKEALKEHVDESLTNAEGVKNPNADKVKDIVSQAKEKTLESLQSSGAQEPLISSISAIFDTLSNSMDYLKSIDNGAIKGINDAAKEFADKSEDLVGILDGSHKGEELAKQIRNDALDMKKEADRAVKEIKAEAEIVKNSAINTSKSLQQSLGEIMVAGMDTTIANTYLKHSFVKQNKHNFLCLKHEELSIDKMEKLKEKMEIKLKNYDKDIEGIYKNALSINPFKKAKLKKKESLKTEIEALEKAIPQAKKTLNQHRTAVVKVLNKQYDMLNQVSQERNEADLKISTRLETSKDAIDTMRNELLTKIKIDDMER